jgi:integrase
MPKVGRITVEDAAEDLVNDYVANNRRSLSSVQRRLKKHLLPFFGGRRLASISTADIRTYTTKRRTDVIVTGADHTARSRTVSNAEINNELKVLGRMFSLAFEDGKVLHVPKVPKLTEHNARKGFFEPDQFTAVRDHLPEFLQPLVTFLYVTGWRISEVRGLEWRQVDFAAGEVRLDPNTTKNDEGRVFPMTIELRVLLERQRAERDRLRQGGHVVPWVFWRLVGKRGTRRQRRMTQKPRSVGSFRKTWIASCAAAGCPERIPHDFRRTAVRNLVRAGIPERVAMMMTGHKTRSVFERYNIVSPSDFREAARKLDFHHGHTFGHTTSETGPSGPSKSTQVVEETGAGDGDRTRDIKLGKLAFYR